MNAPFGDRIKLAQRLENTFIQGFNSTCASHKIVKFGVEKTDLIGIHGHIKTCRDDTSQFLRYLPDSVLVNIENPPKCETAFIEFKVANTGVQQDSLLRELSQRCPEMQPRFQTKEDVLNIENDTLEQYLKFHSIGAKVILIVYASFRVPEDRLRVQFVERIAKCCEYNPNQGKANTGSGTIIANTNFLSFDNPRTFFEQEFKIANTEMKRVIQAVDDAFNRNT